MYMLEQIRQQKENKSNHIYDIVVLSIVLGLVWLFFACQYRSDGMSKLSNFLQIPVLFAIATSSLINVKTYQSTQDNKCEDLSKRYREILEARMAKIDQLFIGNPRLNRLYTQFYTHLPKVPVKVDQELLVLEHQACSVIFKVMFEIYIVLKENSNYRDFQEWVETFKNWTKSPIMIKNWSTVRDEYHPEFKAYIDRFIQKSYGREPSRSKINDPFSRSLKLSS
jgi:hypothetical protein